MSNTMEWKPGWYVLLDDKPLRGPFEHLETADALYFQFTTEAHMQPVKEKLSVKLKLKSEWLTPNRALGIFPKAAKK